jgi:CRP/FNR family cyclic AMP-dependent transcriptional regulator
MVSERNRRIQNQPPHSGDPGEPFHAAANAAGAMPDDPEVVGLVVDDPQTALESGEVLFAEGDPPTCMYVVKNGTLRIRSGSVIYEDVGPGGIVGEMGLVEANHTRSATVYALTDCELVAIDKARFFSLVTQAPNFAITVMQVLSRRLRAMDRRYRAEPWV